NPPGYKAEYSAIDIVGRYLYLLNPRNDQATGGEIGNLGNKSELLRWHIDKKTLEFLMYMPTASGVDHNTMVFDTVNRELIIPWNRNLNTNPSGPEFLQIYHASTGFLERQEIVTSTGGPLKCNGFWFDPFANA